MSTIDYFEQTEELAVFLRNADVLTTTQRSVTTATATGTFASTSSLLINRTNVKNIRSITVAGSALTYSDDYSVDYDYDDSGTIKCKITFVAAQTGAYSIPYDYGSDKIFPDFPKTSLTINNFPRIAVETISANTTPGGFGNVNETETTFTVVAYSSSTKEIKDILTSVRNAFVNAYTSFKTVGNLVRPLSLGPLITTARDSGKDKIFQQNLDFVANFNLEKN